MKDGAIIIDRFSAGLDDLARTEQGDLGAVLRVLHRTGRFSCFEACENPTIAATMTTICQGGYVETKDAGYPWTKVMLTAKGLEVAGVTDEEKS